MEQRYLAPGGLEFEVMDMIYRLPFRDWLELNSQTGVKPRKSANRGLEMPPSSGLAWSRLLRDAPCSGTMPR